MATGRAVPPPPCGAGFPSAVPVALRVHWSSRFTLLQKQKQRLHSHQTTSRGAASSVTPEPAAVADSGPVSEKLRGLPGGQRHGAHDL